MRPVKTGHDSPLLSWLAIGASLLVALGWWHWANTILIPSSTADAHVRKIPVGNNSDLYPRWLGTRELLLRERDPYSEDITREIQKGYYGRVLDAANPDDPKDQSAFAYPLYVAFVLAPFVHTSFAQAQVIFQWLLLVCIGLSFIFWEKVINLRLPWEYKVLGIVLLLSTPAAFSEFHKQNLSGLIILALAISFWAIRRNWLSLAGFMLAWSTLKPQLSWLFILFLLLWAISFWRHRQRLVWSFLLTIVVLILAGNSLLSGWLHEFVNSLRAYENYAGDPSIIQVLLPGPLAWIVTLLLLGWMAFRCWRARAAAADSAEFIWTVAAIATITLAVMNKLASYNHPLLLPAWFVLLKDWKKISQVGLLARALGRGCAACFIWTWASALVISTFSLFLPASSLRVVAGVPQYTLLALTPVTMLAILISELYLYPIHPFRAA